MTYTQPKESLVTRFTKDELPRYQRALKIYVKLEELYNLTIEENATDDNGIVIPGVCALNTSSDREISKFWKIFDETDFDRMFTLSEIVDLIQKSHVTD